MLPKLTGCLKPFLLQKRSVFILTVGVGILNSLVVLLLPLTMGYYYELLLGRASNRAQMLETLGLGGNLNWTLFWMLFVSLILLRGLFTYIEYRLTSSLSEKLAQYLRERVFTHQLAVQLETHRQKKVGKYLLRYASDFQSVRRYLSIGVIGFLRDIVFVVLALAVLASLNATITGLLLVGIVPFWVVFVKINEQLKLAIQHRRDQRSANLSFVQSALVGFETIQLFNRETVENDRFLKRSNRQTASSFAVLKWRSLLEGLLPIALYGLVAIVLLGTQWQQSVVGGGSVITFILAVLSLRPTLRRLLRVATVWKSGNLSLDKLEMFLAQSAEKITDEISSTKAPENRLKILNGTVEFRNVTFGYDAQNPIVVQLSFRTEMGQVYWISGHVKSTIFRLLTKQYEFQKGDILIDNQSIGDFSDKEVRKRMALVSTELPLLGRTVFESVSYSRKSEKRPEAALVLAQIQSLAQLTYPLHLDDCLGENGQPLSMGQRTVLAWVRALLTKKPILLLDDPFEGLSQQGARQLYQWLEKQVFHKTIILATRHPRASFETYLTNGKHSYSV